VFPKR